MSDLPRVLIVEDDESLTRAIMRAIRNHADASRASSVADAKDFLDTKGAVPLIIDVNLEDGSGFDVLAHARTKRSDVPALFLSGDASHVNQAYALGAKFLLKPVAASWLVDFVVGAQIHQVANGDDIADVVTGWSRRYSLTPSEQQILAAAAIERVPRKDIQKAVGKPDATVKSHVRHLLAKTKHETLSDAVTAILRETLDNKKP